jgi:hypothetical protein
VRFDDIVLSQKGKRICVMGGSESLVGDLKSISADIYISTNGHGAELVKPTYVVAMDQRHSVTDEYMGDRIRSKTGAPIISPRDYADISLTNWPQYPRDILSGVMAAWVSFMLGAKVVILAGMDGYKDKGFIHEYQKIARDIKCPVRVMSGELAHIWPLYRENERFRFEEHSSIKGWLGADADIQVEVLKPTTVYGLLRKKGDTFKARRHDSEIEILLMHKMLAEL